MGNRLEEAEFSNRGYYGTAGIGKGASDFEDLTKLLVEATAAGDRAVFVRYHAARQPAR